MQNLIIFQQNLRQIHIFLSLGARCTRPVSQKLLIYVKWAETWFHWQDVLDWQVRGDPDQLCGGMWLDYARCRARRLYIAWHSVIRTDFSQWLVRTETRNISVYLHHLKTKSSLFLTDWATHKEYCSRDIFSNEPDRDILSLLGTLW